MWVVICGRKICIGSDRALCGGQGESSEAGLPEAGPV